MTKWRHLVSVACALSLALPGSAMADNHTQNVTSELDVELSGWARIEYGLGENRYADTDGNDRFGLSRGAFVTEASVDDFSLTALFGATSMSNADDELDIEQVYIDWAGVGGSNLDLSLGVQSLGFGLKPSRSFEGDRSIIPSLEFGGGGGFNVGEQTEAAIIASHPIIDGLDLELGAFDTDQSAADGTDGSSIADNGFVQIRADGLGFDGLYGVAGLEARYDGATDDTATIYSLGLGFGTDMIDLSAEVIGLDKELTGTVDDEMLVVVELTVSATEDMRIIVDWSTADEADIDTIRAGVHYDINSHVEARVEYAGDFVEQAVGSDVHSVDGRLTLTY